MSVTAVKRFVKELVVRSMEEDVTPTPQIRPVPPLRSEPAPWSGVETPGYLASRAPVPRPERRDERRRSRRDEANELLFPIGFYANQVPAGEEVDIEVRPQTDFRGDQLVIPSEIAKAFDVVDVKIGKDSQRVTNDRVPGTVFDPSAFSPRLKLPTAAAGMTITLRVVNVTEDPEDFKAALFGAVEDDS